MFPPPHASQSLSPLLPCCISFMCTGFNPCCACFCLHHSTPFHTALPHPTPHLSDWVRPPSPSVHQLHIVAALVPTEREESIGQKSSRQRFLFGPRQIEIVDRHRQATFALGRKQCPHELCECGLPHSLRCTDPNEQRSFITIHIPFVQKIGDTSGRSNHASCDRVPRGLLRGSICCGIFSCLLLGNAYHSQTYRELLRHFAMKG